MACQKLDCSRLVKQIQFDKFFQRNVAKFTSVDGNKVFCFPEKVLKDRYRLDAILAVGGFGVLFKAIDTKVFDRTVLVKTPLFEDHQLMVRNNRALELAVTQSKQRSNYERKMILHGHLRRVSNIPVIIDWGADIGPLIRGPHRDENGAEFYHDNPQLFTELPYLVLNFFEGQELGMYFTRKSFLEKPLSTLFHFIKPVAATLERFHRLEDFGSKRVRFVYQDLKPENILGTPEGLYILIDFGSFAYNSPGEPWGNIGIHTEGYCAPEFQKDISPQLDVYSLGIVIREIWENMKKASVGSEISDKYKEFPPGWDRFVTRCTENDRMKRFKDMTELLEELNGLPRERNF